MDKIKNTKELGAVYTKPIIVVVMLDLIGYTSEKSLYEYSLLDPSFGHGVFLEIATERLLESIVRDLGSIEQNVGVLMQCIRGVEYDETSVQVCRARLGNVFRKYKLSDELVSSLLDKWLIHGDFLLWQNENTTLKFDYVVGNPPYVRQELIDTKLLDIYRRMYKTIYDRADLYVPFIQHGLELLSESGKLCFICADRFMRNRYGKVLRKFISENYTIEYLIDLHKTSPFEVEVSAYPSVFIIKNEIAQRPVRAVSMSEITPATCLAAKKYLIEGEPQNKKDVIEYKYEKWFQGDSPWIIESKEYLETLSYLETNFPIIEDAVHGCKVGIGVATGADKVFIVNNDEDVETEVLVPIVTTKDINTGEIKWLGKYVINPFRSSGELIELDNYPRLNKYFEIHKDQILARNVAKKNPRKWYKTIDRIYPELVNQPKLLIPDIKGDNLIVKDDGEFYPHHNLYYVLPGMWHLDVLQTFLLSSITKFFIWSYATKMRGDYLRYQAQYLRKIRLPLYDSISDEDKDLLLKALTNKNHEEIDIIVAGIYGLSKERLEMILETVQ